MAEMDADYGYLEDASYFLEGGNYWKAKEIIQTRYLLPTKELNTLAIELAIDNADFEFMKHLIGFDYDAKRVLIKAAKERNKEAAKLVVGRDLKYIDRFNAALYSGDVGYVNSVCEIYRIFETPCVDTESLKIAAGTNLETFKYVWCVACFSLEVLYSAIRAGNIEVVEFIRASINLSEAQEKAFKNYCEMYSYEFPVNSFLYVGAKYDKTVRSAAIYCGNLELLLHFGCEIEKHWESCVWSREAIEYVLAKKDQIPLEEFISKCYRAAAIQDNTSTANILHSRGYLPMPEMFMREEVFPKFLRWLEKHGCML